MCVSRTTITKPGNIFHRVMRSKSRVHGLTSLMSPGTFLLTFFGVFDSLVFMEVGFESVFLL